MEGEPGAEDQFPCSFPSVDQGVAWAWGPLQNPCGLVDASAIGIPAAVFPAPGVQHSSPQSVDERGLDLKVPMNNFAGSKRYKDIIVEISQCKNRYKSKRDVNSGSQSYPAAPVILLPAATTDHMLPPTQLEAGYTMGVAALPFANSYYDGMVAACGGQTMIHPDLVSIQQFRMPLPSEIMEEEPVYVNAKQYHGILRRRQARAKAESESRVAKTRKPYLHESRHQHALRRERGCGGRFLNKRPKDNGTMHTDSSLSSQQSFDASPS